MLHFVLFPLMAQGHMIPMVDVARLLAQHGVMITIVTTPHNASRFDSLLARANQSGLQIQVIQLHFPYQESDGLPQGCENIDQLPSLQLVLNFLTAANTLHKPAETLFDKLTPRPSCIISDMCLPYTINIARKFNIPRISFHGFGCFCLLVLYKVKVSKVLESVNSETEYFEVPDFPGKIEVTKTQLPGPWRQNIKEFGDQMVDAEMGSYGVVINSFEELESEFVKEYKRAKGNKVWCIGPVSLCNKDNLDKSQRGNIKNNITTSINEDHVLNWLDSQEPNSVIYVCFGSLCNIAASQLIELGRGLEESNRPFVWVIRKKTESEELHMWVVEDGFEERVKGRGVVIWGWAPQLMILPHPAIGGFITHCGWNSTLEAICSGVPMVTWPLFADQFLNEKLIVQVLKVAVSVGVEEPVAWGEEEKVGVVVKKEVVMEAIDRVMGGEEESEERRERARELAEKAKKAMDEGGSSQLNITLFIEDIMKQENSKESN